MRVNPPLFLGVWFIVVVVDGDGVILEVVVVVVFVVFVCFVVMILICLCVFVFGGVNPRRAAHADAVDARLPLLALGVARRHRHHCSHICIYTYIHTYTYMPLIRPAWCC